MVFLRDGVPRRVPIGRQHRNESEEIALSQRRDIVIIDKGSYKIYKFHGSVYGGCAHRHVLDYLNPNETPPAPSSFQESIFARGDTAEAWVKQQLSKAGWNIRGGSTNFTEQVNVSIIGPVDLDGFAERDRICISASLDGVLTKWTGGPPYETATKSERRLEVKALGKKGFGDIVDGGSINAIDQYAWQVSAAMWGIDWKAKEKGDARKDPMPMQIVVVRQGEYSNEDGTINRDGVFFETLTQSQYQPDEMLQRCRDILVMCRDGIVPACNARYPCAWTGWEKEQATVEVFDEEMLDALTDYDTALSDLAFQTGIVDTKREEVKTMVRSRLNAQHGCIICGDWKATVTKNNRLNVKSLL